MPGILRGVARTAVVAGTATHVAGNVSHRQQKKFAAQDQSATTDQEPELESQPVSDEDAIAQLKQWADLKDKGIITQEDFDAKKKQILGV